MKMHMQQANEVYKFISS